MHRTLWLLLPVALLRNENRASSSSSSRIVLSSPPPPLAPAYYCSIKRAQRSLRKLAKEEAAGGNHGKIQRIDREKSRAGTDRMMALCVRARVRRRTALRQDCSRRAAPVGVEDRENPGWLAGWLAGVGTGNLVCVYRLFHSDPRRGR